MPAVKLLHVEDNSDVAEAIRIRFRREPGFMWLGSLPNADDLVVHVAAARPHVVILDLDLPGSGALVALRKVSAMESPPRVIIYSGQVTHDGVDAAIQAGAWGFVSKNDGEDAIVNAVGRVLADEFILSPEARQAYDHG